ncbi:unnamed protein product [Ceratitis capitata]|uniref:(Mediterranean fruit fly) hypothetical protein n=1 Tax=Ceratitis capitata TaxID=7213 RepID=A0A811US13_CERCA|nr:unnamed protein product [Ceratitis capitata]
MCHPLHVTKQPYQLTSHLLPFISFHSLTAAPPRKLRHACLSNNIFLCTLVLIMPKQMGILCVHYPHTCQQYYSLLSTLRHTHTRTHTLGTAFRTATQTNFNGFSTEQQERSHGSQPNLDEYSQ